MAHLMDKHIILILWWFDHEVTNKWLKNIYIKKSHNEGNSNEASSCQ